MMYEALVARIRYHIQKANFMGLKEAESTLLLGEAADAIEDLSKAQVQWIEQERKVLLQSIHRWIPVEEQLPDEFVSVQAHMTDAGPFPSVREAYLAGGKWFFPALTEYHPVDKWAYFQEPPKEEI